MLTYALYYGLGFLTFGGNSNGLILNSYASNDRSPYSVASLISLFAYKLIRLILNSYASNDRSPPSATTTLALIH
jgi:hypothetical protein